MAAIFISHSSKDAAITAEVRERLEARGHRSLFVDFDPELGIPAGRDWERELYRSLRACQVVLVLCSEHSLTSRWCFAEITHAKMLGKTVIPVRVAPCELPPLVASNHAVDLVTDEEDGYERLWHGLDVAGLHAADAFHWDGKRSPYPGLMHFEEADAAVFFGRDPEIQEGLEELQKLRRSGGGSALVVLGASGSGKSSLVRAGLLPRLRRRPERWLVVDPFRPQERPLQELAIALAGGFHAAGEERDWKRERDALEAAARQDPPDGGVLAEILLELAVVSGARDATVVVTIDQFEELLGPEVEARATEFLSLIEAALRSQGERLAIVCTLRSDFLGAFQQHEGGREFPFVDLRLSPMSVDRMWHVIEGPARKAGVELEDGLTQLLLEDAGSPDALPMLAFTLRELYDKCGADDLLEVSEYRDELGGLGGSLEKAAEEALRRACGGSDERRRELRDALVDLVQIDQDGRYTRRPQQPWSRFSGEVQGMLEHFVAARLLISDDRGDRVLEVAHEALLRSWTRLAEWLDDSREALHARARLEAAEARWRDSGLHEDFLLPEGRPLEEGRALLPELLGGVREFVEASIDAGAKAAETRRKRARRFLVAVCSVVAFGALAGYAVWEARQSDLARDAAQTAQERTNTLKMAYEAHVLALESPVGYPEALAQALEATVADLRVGREPHAAAYAALNLAARRMETGTPLEHRDTVNDVSFSPDGTLALTASQDGTAALWRADGGALVARLGGHTGPVYSADFSDDGSRVLTNSSDGTAALWSSPDGRRIATFESASSLAELSPDGSRVLSVSNDGAPRIRSAEDGTLLHTLPVDDQRPQFSPDGSRVLTVSGNTASLWSVDTGSVQRHFEGHTTAIVTARFSPDGSRIATAATGDPAEIWLWSIEERDVLRKLDPLAGGARVFDRRTFVFSPDGRRLGLASGIWNVDDGTLLHAFEHGDWVDHVAFSPGGGKFITVSRRGVVRIWETESGTLRHSLDPRGGLAAALFSPSGWYLLTKSNDGTVRIWNAEDGEELYTLEGPKGFSNGVAYSPDGSRVIVAAGHGAVIRRAYPDTLLRVCEGHPSRLHDVVLSPDGTRVAGTSGGEAVRIWRVRDGALLHTLGGPGIWLVRFSPDGRRLLTVSSATLFTGYSDLHDAEDSAPIARLWDVADGSLLHTFDGHANRIVSAEFSADGDRVLTASLDRTIRLWSADDGELVRELEEEELVLHAALSRDGDRILSGSLDMAARVRSADDGRVLATLEGHTRPVFFAEFSADGTRALTASEDLTVRIWDTAGGRELHTLEGHTASLTSASFSPDGTLVLTASRDRTARLWSTDSGALLRTLRGHAGRVDVAAFSPEGDRVLTTSSDGSARIWDTASGTLLSTLTGYTESVPWTGIDGGFPATFSSDGARVVTAFPDPAVRVWAASKREWLDLAWRAALPHEHLLTRETREWLRANTGPVPPRHRSSWNILPPLHVAVIFGEVAAVRALLLEGEPADRRDLAGRSALHFAARAGDSALVQLLLEHGATPTAEDSTGTTPLDYAKDGEHTEAVALLKGAD